MQPDNSPPQAPVQNQTNPTPLPAQPVPSQANPSSQTQAQPRSQAAYICSIIGIILPSLTIVLSTVLSFIVKDTSTLNEIFKDVNSLGLIVSIYAWYVGKRTHDDRVRKNGLIGVDIQAVQYALLLLVIPLM